MSSETSTSQNGLVSPKRVGAEADSLQPWQLFTLAGLIGATVVVFMSRGQTPAGIILLSLIIFAAAAVGLAALRTFMPFAGGTTDVAAEIVGGRTRAALEREKTLVLRSIKELEFDRGMGKVSEKDFAEMTARLRTRAARLMRQLDAGSVYREQIEKEIAKRLGNAGSAPPLDSARGALREVERARDPAYIHPAAVARPSTPAQGAPSIVEERSRPAECPSCQTPNDPDAKFCKNCGTRMEHAS